MNVVPFSVFQNDRQVQAHQLGLPRVILEGEDDVQMFNEWFGHLAEELEFIEASRIGSGSGCTAVPNAVEISRGQDGIPAVGVLDRDAVHRESRWSVMYETDDEVFAGETRTDEIYTTTLWEVEAYLLRPELLSEWVGAQTKTLPAKPLDRAQALARTLEECEALVSAMTFYSAAHASGQGMPDKHFVDVAAGDLVGACTAHKANDNADHKAAFQALEPLLAKVRAEAPEDVSQRLEYFLRFVDTKRLLARLTKRLRLRENAHWGLSSLMSGKALRPAELEAFLVATAARYAA